MKLFFKYIPLFQVNCEASRTFPSLNHDHPVRKETLRVKMMIPNAQRRVTNSHQKWKWTSKKTYSG